jgi:hypothetical protein
MTTALATTNPNAVVLLDAAPPDALEACIQRYTGIQRVLDRSLSDCTMNIQGHIFRKKSYWRAVAVAFSLEVVCVKEERITLDKDWGYLVTYRAGAANGRGANGDGACMASEKKGAQATLHNVRSHAHTRAYNRAVSNLVGFGEVSAEEVDRDGNIPDSGPVIYADDPSWPGEKEAFIATLAGLTVPDGRNPPAVSEVSSWSEHLGRAPVHALDSTSRAKLLEYLRTDKGIKAFLTYRDGR